MTSRMRGRKAVIVLSLAALAAHLPLLLIRGIFWDGWLYHTFAERRDVGALWWHLSSEGRPLQALMLAAVGYLPALAVTTPALCLAALITATLLVFRVLRNTELFSEGFCLGSSLLFAVYPAYTINVSYSAIVTIFCTALFWMGLHLGGIGDVRGARTKLQLCAGALCLALSFAYEAFYTLCYLFLALDIYAKGHLRSLSRRQVAFLALPAASWILTAAWFEKQGVYFDANMILYTPAALFIRFYDYARYLLVRIPREILSSLNMAAIVFAVAATVGCMLAFDALAQRKEARRHRVTLWFSTIALCLAAFPYALVGKVPYEGWTIRWAITLGLPLAMAGMSFAERLWETGARGARWAALLVFNLWWIGWMAHSWSDYFALYERWLRDQATIVQLQERADWRDISTFWVVDPVGDEYGEPKRYYEWAGMFRRAWGDESHVGLDVRAYDSHRIDDLLWLPKRPYLLSDYDPRGREAILLVCTGSLSPPPRVLRRLARMLTRHVSADPFYDADGRYVRLELRPGGYKVARALTRSVCESGGFR